MPTQKSMVKLPPDLAADAQAVARLHGETLEGMVVRILTLEVKNVKMRMAAGQSSGITESVPAETVLQPPAPEPEPVQPDDGGIAALERAKARAGFKDGAEAKVAELIRQTEAKRAQGA